MGRHFRIDDKTEIIVGRNREDNMAIQNLSEDQDIIIRIRDFPGPTVLVPCGCDEKTFYFAAAVCALYSDAPKDREVIASCLVGGSNQLIPTMAAKKDEVKKLII